MDLAGVGISDQIAASIADFGGLVQKGSVFHGSKECLSCQGGEETTKHDRHSQGPPQGRLACDLVGNGAVVLIDDALDLGGGTMSAIVGLDGGNIRSIFSNIRDL